MFVYVKYLAGKAFSIVPIYHIGNTILGRTKFPTMISGAPMKEIHQDQINSRRITLVKFPSAA